MKKQTCTKRKIMEKQVPQRILAITMLITLIMFQILYATCGVVSAVYEELETQNISTNQKNVSFDAIFKTTKENKHSTEAIIKDGENLTFCIDVKNTGVLNHAKISIEKANFKIQQTKNQYIKNINTETNEIELNQLIAGNQVEITVPIKFEKTEQISKNYTSQESTVKLTGSYKNTQNKEKSVKGETKIRVSWTQEPEITIDQEIEKYINLEDNKTLIQQKVRTQMKESVLVENKTLETEVPEIQNTLPNEVNVLINGKQIKKEDYTYNKQNKTITIKNEQKNEQEEYKIIYQYPIKKETEIPITLRTKMQAKLYTEKTIEKQDQKQVQARRTTNNISIQNKVTTNIYKGYMYAGVENKTEYEDNISIEISSLEQIEKIEISKMNDYFIDQSENRKNINNSIYINNIKLNKNNIENILGENFEIQIIGENNQNLYNITKESNWEENGEINLQTKETNLEEIKIILSQPKNIGTINIEMDKHIKGNTGYNKEELKNIKEIENTKIISVAGEQIKVQSTSKLEDTIEETRIDISNTNLSTTEQNKNVQIIAVLKSDNEKYNLYKNPYIEIKLPEELQQIKINSINILYGQELNVEKAIYNQQTKTIQMQFNGEQTQFKTQLEEGIKIVISADLTFKKNIPSKQAQIIMTSKNENTNNQQQTVANINLNSKYGAILYNGIHNYNEENTVIETTEDSKLYGNLNIEGQEEQAIIHQAFINNYETPINKIAIVGNITEENVKAQLNNLVINKENAKIYYSEQENAKAQDKTWQENEQNIEEIKSYKIEFAQDLEPADTIDIAYKLNIPEKLEQNVRNKSKHKCNILL